MDNREIKDKLFDILVERLAISKDSITLEQRLSEDLGVQPLSTDSVDLLLEIEEKFGVKIDNDEYVRLLTVGDILGYLDRCINNGEDDEVD